MSNFVSLFFYRSNVTVDKKHNYLLAPKGRSYWVFQLIIEDEWNVEKYRLSLTNLDWESLESDLAELDGEICTNLAAHFPRELLGYNFLPRYLSQKPTIFDEYSNQYFSGLMNVISGLPTR